MKENHQIKQQIQKMVRMINILLILILILLLYPFKSKDKTHTDGGSFHEEGEYKEGGSFKEQGNYKESGKWNKGSKGIVKQVYINHNIHEIY